MTESAIELDNRDFRLIRLLQSDARISNADLAQRVGMSESTCARRRRALEAAGIIRGYGAFVDAHRLGFGISAYLMVNLDQRGATDSKTFFSFVEQESRITECVALTGPHDILLRLVVRSIEELGEFTMDRLLKLPSVRAVTSCVVLRAFKQGPAYRF